MMPRTCTICGHAERAAIDAALVANQPSLRDIARQFGVTKDALFRHREHLAETLTRAVDAREVAHGGDLLSQVQSLHTKALSILDTAEGAGDLRTALAAIREARGCLELLAEMEGELNRSPQLNVIISPEWQRVRAVILTALAPYPDARQAVSSDLLAIEGGSP